MAAITSIPVSPPPPLLKLLQQPRSLIVLVLLMWVPLTLNVMLAGSINESLRPYLLCRRSRRR